MTKPKTKSTKAKVPARGDRNNNPGNIRLSKDKWQGLAKNQTDDEFFVFSEPSYGIRAIARILIKYQDDYNIHNITGIINRWAPPVENNTNAYINMVSKETGFEENKKLNLQKFEHLFPIVKAIIKHELGYQPYTDALITKGLVLAGVEPIKKESVTQTRTVRSAQVGAAAASLTVIAEAVEKTAPAFPLLSKVAEFAPIVLAIVVIGVFGYIIYVRYDDWKKGLR